MKTLIIPALIPALALTVVHSAASAAPGSASGPNALALAAVRDHFQKLIVGPQKQKPRGKRG